MVLVKTNEFTIETLGFKRLCPECGTSRIRHGSIRCRKCQSKHSLRKAWGSH